MKAKEFFTSLWRSFRLSKLPADKLKQKSESCAPVVVSLTSIPSRLPILHLAIRSMLHQSTPPEKIILWLHHDLESQLPPSLTSLCGPVFTIRFVNLTCSHRKLIHSLEAFPDSIIVTADDDQMYGYDWLEKLYASHLKSPADVIANSCRRIMRFENGEVLPYWDWKRDFQPGVSAPSLMGIGYAGILYPPRCLASDATNEELFLSLVPKADDMWFKAMASINGTAVRISHCPSSKPVHILNSQGISLKSSNVDSDENRVQWERLAAHYQLEGLAEVTARKA